MEADWVQEGRGNEAGPWVSRFGCLGGPTGLSPLGDIRCVITKRRHSV